MNAFPSTGKVFDDGYVLNKCHSNAYIYVRCKQKRCKFRILFANGGNFEFKKASYLSHCPDQHLLFSEPVYHYFQISCT